MTVKEKESKIKETSGSSNLDDLFSVGAHYAYKRSRRHPSVKDYIFGVKNGIEIFDLEKVEEEIRKAENLVESLGRGGKTILFVGGKNEAKNEIKNIADNIGMPYVAGRWIGGTLTNFSQIRSRVDKLNDLESQKEKGELSKYKKKERLLIEREMESLTETFEGIRDLSGMPDVMFIVDIKREQNALREALSKNIPVITLSGSDCDIDAVNYPIPANDSSKSSIRYVLKRVAEAYQKGKSFSEK